MVISTGMMFPRWDSVAALYCLTNSMMLTPCGPSAVPTGGAGVAAPAFSCTLTSATIFFFLGAICFPYLSYFLHQFLTSLPNGSGGVTAGCLPPVAAADPIRLPGGRSELADLIEGQLDRRLATEDRHEHLELLSIGIDLAHCRRKGRERAVHHGNRLVDLEVDRRRPHRLGLLRGLLLGHRGQQRANLVQAQRRRPAGQSDEAGHSRSVADRSPRLVGQLHPHQDVAGQHLLLNLLPLAALDLDYLVRGDLDLEDEVLHVEGLSAALQIRPDPVLITCVGVHHVPLAGKSAQLSGELGNRIDFLGAISVLHAVSFVSSGADIPGSLGVVARHGVGSPALVGALRRRAKLVERADLIVIDRLGQRVANRQFGLGHDSSFSLLFLTRNSWRFGAGCAYPHRRGAHELCNHAATLCARILLSPSRRQPKTASTILVKPKSTPLTIPTMIRMKTSATDV